LRKVEAAIGTRKRGGAGGGHRLEICAFYLIPHGHKRQDHLRLHRSAECHCRRKLSERKKLAQPTIRFWTLRPRQDLIVNNATFVSNMSLDNQWFIKTLFIAGREVNPIGIRRVYWPIKR